MFCEAVNTNSTTITSFAKPMCFVFFLAKAANLIKRLHVSSNMEIENRTHKNENHGL